MTRKDEERKRLEALRSLRAFEDCTLEELAQIDSLITESRVSAGRILMREGAPGFEFMVIVEGTAVVTRDGNEVARVGPGEFVGEMALISAEPGARSATVTAETDLRLYVMNAGEFGALLDGSPTMREKIFRTKAMRNHPAGGKRS